MSRSLPHCGCGCGCGTSRRYVDNKPGGNGKERLLRRGAQEGHADSTFRIV
jgi:hypothetical protein